MPPPPPSEQGPSGSEQLPGGEQGDGDAKETVLTWETQPAGGGAEGSESPEASDSAEGSEGGSEGAEGNQGGQPGSQGNESSDSAEPAGADDGWETSNEIPGVANSETPAAEGEEGQPPGGSDDVSEEGSVAGAEGELDAALEDFDGEILAEREVIRARSNEGATSSPVGLPSPATSGGAPDSTAVVVGPQGIPSQRNAPPAPAGGAPIPEDIADARDDDIIARQLREAAMNETDPDLREKLWDEYRRYKGA